MPTWKEKEKKKTTKKKSEYLAEVLERMCAKPQLGSHSQLSTGFPTGLLLAHSSHQEDGSFQPRFSLEEDKKPLSPLHFFRAIPRRASISGTLSPLLCCHSWLLKSLQMQVLRGIDFHGESLLFFSFFFFFFLCIENAFRRLTLHFWYPEVINYLYQIGKM